MYKPKVRVNVAEGAYVVILNWQAEGPAVKGAGVGYVSNKAWIQVSGDRFQGFIVSKFHAMGDCIAARVDQGVRRENALMGRWCCPRAWGPSTPLDCRLAARTMTTMFGNSEDSGARSSIFAG
jgi:hypothetical protein